MEIMRPGICGRDNSGHENHRRQCQADSSDPGGHLRKGSRQCRLDRPDARRSNYRIEIRIHRRGAPYATTKPCVVENIAGLLMLRLPTRGSPRLIGRRRSGSATRTMTCVDASPFPDSRPMFLSVRDPMNGLTCEHDCVSRPCRLPPWYLCRACQRGDCRLWL